MKSTIKLQAFFDVYENFSHCEELRRNPFPENRDIKGGMAT